MAIVRILIDGYSLLHRWGELANGHPRHSALARDELIHWLTQYRDTIGTPITVFFDGAGAPAGTPKAVSTREMEVLYSKRGQTADSMIERAAYRFRTVGEVLVVTDDVAERDTVLSVGASVSSCGQFIQAASLALNEQHRELHHHNRKERSAFRSPSNH